MARNDPGAFPQDLHRALPPLLDEVHALAHRLRQADARHSDPDGLHAGQLQVLQVLAEHGPGSVPQIGRLRNTSRQSVQTIVNQLASEGAVALLPNPAHRRSPLVRITEKGMDLLKTTHRRRPQWSESELLELTAEEVRSALSVLKQVHAALSGLPLARSKKPALPAPPEVIPSPVMTEQLEMPDNELPVNLL